jgi:hypothetical protein
MRWLGSRRGDVSRCRGGSPGESVGRYRSRASRSRIPAPSRSGLTTGNRYVDRPSCSCAEVVVERAVGSIGRELPDSAPGVGSALRVFRERAVDAHARAWALGRLDVQRARGRERAIAGA